MEQPSENHKCIFVPRSDGETHDLNAILSNVDLVDVFTITSNKSSIVKEVIEDEEDHGKISLTRSDGINHCIINVFKGSSDSRGETLKLQPSHTHIHSTPTVTQSRNLSSTRIDLPRGLSLSTISAKSLEQSGSFPANVRIVHMSDTYNFLSSSNPYDFLPKGSVFVHSGNFTTYGSKKEFDQFNAWLGSIATDFPYRVICFGCRDVKEYGNNWDIMKRLLFNATHVLCHDTAIIQGIKFYGSPWHWGHHKNYKVRSGAPSSTSGRFDDIPDGIQVLITHGASLNCLDTSNLPGSRELSDAIRRVKPSVHLHGHSKGAHGIVLAFARSPLVVNSSLCDPDGRVMYACAHVIKATQTSTTTDSSNTLSKEFANWNFSIDSLMN